MKLLAIFGTIRHWLGNGGTGNTVGNIAANGGATLALVAAIAPAVIWVNEHRNEVFLSLDITYGWFAVGSVLLAVYIKVIHLTRPGKPTDRQDGQPGQG